MCKSHNLTTISISRENYLNLMKLGTTGDSFNHVITELLSKIKQSDQRPQSQDPTAVRITPNQGDWSNDR
jgi:hypothetical protein